MKKTTENMKNTMALWSALGMLVYGAGITTAGFIVPPLGEVHHSVLTILGQMLIYSGSIFGITLYTKQRLNEIETKIYENSNSRDCSRE